MAKTLTDVERLTLMLSGWDMTDDRDAVQKQFKFGNFVDAFNWMTKVSTVANSMDHHPEWSNMYNKVNVVLTTHSLGGLSDLDLELAQKMDALFTD